MKWKKEKITDLAAGSYSNDSTNIQAKKMSNNIEW